MRSLGLAIWLLTLVLAVGYLIGEGLVRRRPFSLPVQYACVALFAIGSVAGLLLYLVLD
jgi:hypothetical protein